MSHRPSAWAHSALWCSKTQFLGPQCFVVLQDPVPGPTVLCGALRPSGVVSLVLLFTTEYSVEIKCFSGEYIRNIAVVAKMWFLKVSLYCIAGYFRGVYILRILREHSQSSKIKILKNS